MDREGTKIRIWRGRFILAIDDDVSVLEAVVQDLRRQYGNTYRVMRAAGGQAALDTLAQLKSRDEPVALIVSDQRMPGNHRRATAGAGARHLSRRTPRALTAYADTEAAIRAINTARIHYYSTSPGIRRKKSSIPSSTISSRIWQAGYVPVFEGLRVIGSRWSLADFRVRNFLSRNHVPYRWLDVAAGPEAAKLSRIAKPIPQASRVDLSLPPGFDAHILDSFQLPDQRSAV